MVSIKAMALPPPDEDDEPPAKSKRVAVIAFVGVFIMAAVRVVRRF
jgi:hypothetical protein